LGWSVREQNAVRGVAYIANAKKVLHNYYARRMAKDLPESWGKTLTPVTLAAEDDSHGLGRSTYPQRNIASREAGVDRRTQP
jgi:hypothetical protein